MTEQTSQSTLQVHETSTSLTVKEDFERTLIETLKKHSVIYQIRKRRRDRKKKEFLGRLKHGKKYRTTDDPGPY